MYYKDWLPEWLENYVKPTTKSKTYLRYEEISRRHLVPSLGQYAMEELTPLLLQRYVTGLLQNGNLKTGQGLSPSTVNGMIAVLRGSMDVAYRIGMAESYVMDKVKRPKMKERPVECFTLAEQRQIEAAVLSDPRIKMRGIVICLYTGLRIGELLALQWEDIDWRGAELRVNKNCRDGTDEAGRYCRVVDSPKTASSRRTVPLSPAIVRILREMHKNSLSPWVITGAAEVLSVRSYQRSFERLLQRLGLPHRGFHSLRHTFATRALECGMDVKTLSELLGHRSPGMTLRRYAHSMAAHKREMVNRMGKML